MPRPRSRVRYHAPGEPARTRPPARSRPGASAIPAVDPWVAGEMFVSPHVEERRRGLAILVGTEAARRSLLTPQLLAARIDEPDLPLRAQIAMALADYFELRGVDYRYPFEVRAALLGHLRKFDRQQLLPLLELHEAAREGDVHLAPDVLVRLLARVPDASAQLLRLAGDRSLRLNQRGAAIDLIGRVGFTDALQPLEGLADRLEGRRAGQLAMAFAPSDNPDEQALLPLLREALWALREAD